MGEENLLQELLFEAEEKIECNERTVTVFGNFAAIPQLATLVEEITARKGEASVMICSAGASFRSSGVFEALMSSLGQLDTGFPFYEGIPAEPSVEDVRKIVEKMKESSPDLVIAAGGGSVMDAVKAAWLSYQTETDVTELFGVNAASQKFPGREFQRVICIPTTSGTGSESTPYANIIVPETGVKRLISDAAIIPSYAFVEPMFTNTMPPALTRDTALDAMVHSIESLLNYRAAESHPEAADRAVLAVRLIVNGLPMVLENGKNALGRELLSAAAVLGGMNIRDCPTSLPHLCSFSMCGKCTHGQAVAALLPHFWRYYLAEERVREKTLLLRGSFPGETPGQVVDSCEKFILSVGGETRLGKLLHTDSGFIGRLAADAAGNRMKLESAPRSISAENCGEIFRQVLEPVW